MPHGLQESAVVGSAGSGRVLVAKSRDFRKSRAAGRIGVVVGKGLLLSEGDTWRAHRRVVQPAFHHKHVAAWGETMVGEAEAFVSGLADGEFREIHRDMTALTLSIAARTLLDSRLDERDIEGVRRSATIRRPPRWPGPSIY